MAQAHNYNIFARRSYKFKWTMAAMHVRKPLNRVQEMGLAYLTLNYHGKGEFYIFDCINQKIVYKQIVRPKTLCTGDSKPKILMKTWLTKKEKAKRTSKRNRKLKGR